MKVTKELDLTTFEFWSGAKQHEFTYSELNDLEYAIDEIYRDGCSETDINDLFWFEQEMLCEWIGVKYDEYLNR